MSPEEETTLRAEYDRISKTLHDLDMERSMEFTRSQIGKCYVQKWTNDYGLEYLCVTGEWQAFRFSHFTGGVEITRNYNTRNYSAPSARDLQDTENGRWTEITPEEYDAAWSKFVSEIQAMNPHEHFEENP